LRGEKEEIILSYREQEILKLVKNGLSSKEYCWAVIY